MCQVTQEFMHELNGDRLVRVYDARLRELRLDTKLTDREEGLYGWTLPEGDHYLACYGPSSIRCLKRLSVTAEGITETELSLKEYPERLRRVCA